MVARRSGELTQLLVAAGEGDESARKSLWELVYHELRRIARRQMASEAPGRTLQTTVLVHEAYLRLTGEESIQWANRRHFFAAAAEAMRRIRVDDARKRGRQKRGGGQQPQPLEQDPALVEQDPAEIVAVDEALRKLEQSAPRQAEVVKLRYFAGLTVDETADALGVSPRTVDNDWRLARAWLHRELS